MSPDTLLLRQIHPSFVQQERITSQAFKPTPKDERLLSVDHGDKISPVESWKRFISNPTCQSAGVMAVSQAEVGQESLYVIEDGIPYPEHCSIDFSNLAGSQINKKAKKLKSLAEERGWLHQV
jgi:hypothetical protein